MSFQARIISTRHQPVYLLTDSGAGGAKWFYLRLHPGKQTAFQMALRAGTGFDCAQYGEVLARGVGDGPPTHVTWELQAQGVI